MPFPRLSAYGFWCFLIGGIFVMSSVLFGVAPDAGWFMYPPLATQQGGLGADVWLLGLSFIEVASIAAAVELIVGVMKCRPPGMRVNLMPLYAWYVLVVGGMILFAFPPLIAGDFLFELERSFDWPFFDPERGGDPLLWQHLFWIFGHPEVYIVFLPSIAIAAMIIPTAAQRPIVGYSWIVLSAVGTGFLSFGLWVHHMFTTGLPSISLGFFSAASEAVVIPTGVQLFAFVATLMVGRVGWSVPMLYIAGALAIFTAGGLTGVMVALAPFDWQAHDSYFVVAHLHYTLFGGMVFPVMAGVYYFYPFFTKKLMSEKLGRIAFWLTFVGFNITFLPMHLTGLTGHAAPGLHLPRRPGLGLAQHDFDRWRLRDRRRFPGVRLGSSASERPPAPSAAQSVEGGYAGMVPRHPGGVLGCPLHSLYRKPLPALGPGKDRRAHGRRTLLPAGRSGAQARDPGHDGPRRQAHPVHARHRPRLDHALGRPLHRRRLHLPDLPLVPARHRHRRARDLLRDLLALDLDFPHPGKGGERRRAQPSPADLRLRPRVRRLVGRLYHHARRRHGVCQPHLRILLLLDIES